jgi:hypothetical protein
MQLLDLASAHGLELANTLFQHKDIYYHTHRGDKGNLRVIDYILCSSTFCSSIRDCRVFRGEGGRDHRLQDCTIQLQLSTRRQAAPRQPVGTSSMRFAVDLLQQQDIQQQLLGSIHGRFAALAAFDAAEADDEGQWQSFVQTTLTTAAAELGPQPRSRHKGELPQPLCASIRHDHEAFAAWQQRERHWRKVQECASAAQRNPPSAAPSMQQAVPEQHVHLQQATAAADTAKRRFRFLCRLVDQRVQKLHVHQLAARASNAERKWKSGCYAALHKTVGWLFEDALTKVGAQGLLSKHGQFLSRGPNEQLKHFTVYFAEVLSSGRINPQQQEHMEGMEAQLEGRERVARDSSSAASSGGDGSVVSQQHR